MSLLHWRKHFPRYIGPRKDAGWFPLNLVFISFPTQRRRAIGTCAMSRTDVRWKADRLLHWRSTGLDDQLLPQQATGTKRILPSQEEDYASCPNQPCVRKDCLQEPSRFYINRTSPQTDDTLRIAIVSPRSRRKPDCSMVRISENSRKRIENFNKARRKLRTVFPVTLHSKNVYLLYFRRIKSETFFNTFCNLPEPIWKQTYPSYVGWIPRILHHYQRWKRNRQWNATKDEANRHS